MGGQRVNISGSLFKKIHSLFMAQVQPCLGLQKQQQHASKGINSFPNKTSGASPQEWIPGKSERGLVPSSFLLAG